MSKQNKIQMTGVATATANGNGNGNGKKTEKTETVTKPENNVKVVEDFDRKESIKITPHFDCLTTKGIEMFTDMGNLENAKLFIDDLVMDVSNDHTTIAGLMMILDAISRKISRKDTRDMAGDYINWLQDYLFNWTSEGNAASHAYIEAVRSGNFVVGEMPDNSNSEVWAEGIYPPKYKVKAKENGLRAEINSLAETVKALQEQINVKPANDSKLTKPADFTGLYLEEVFKFEWMVPNWALRLEVQNFPGDSDARVVSSVYEKRTDGSVGLEIEQLPDSIEAYKSDEDDERTLKIAA